MNHKQRQLAAIRHETPDRIPVDAQAVENTDAVARLLGIPASAVGDTLDLDGLLVGLGYAGSVGRDPDGNPLTEWGSPRHLDWGTAHVYPLMEAETVSAVERFPWPDPRAYDFAGARNHAAAVSKEYAVRGPRFSALTDPVFLLMGKGGGYICGPDHHIKTDVSPDNTVALFRAARAFREPEYTQDKRDCEPERPGSGSQARRT